MGRQKKTKKPVALAAPARDCITTRLCHDCGRPTTDYRCERCLTAWRARHGVEPEDLE